MGSHVIVFSMDPEADRAFFADVLGHPHVDAGGDGSPASGCPAAARSDCTNRVTRSPSTCERPDRMH